MTVNEILRHLLDKREVKWDYGITGATTTRFNVNGVDLTFMPMRDGLICTTILTPEQAIAATLETETCRFGKPARQNGKRLPCEHLMDENAKLREEFNKMDVWHSKELTAAMAENAKLREENDKLVKVLHEVESDAVDAYHGLQHDCKLLTGEIDDRFMKYWHEQCENTKLREVVQALHYCTTSGECDRCPINSDGTARLMPNDICDIILDCMRELGMKVDLIND